jgi:ribose 5-phosphate isomerase
MNKSKSFLAESALCLIQDGMIVGVGAGSTIDIFVEKLIEHVKQSGIHIKFVSASLELNQKASVPGITVLDVSNVSEIDLFFDGADFVDVDKSFVSKGNGGFIYNENYLVKFAKRSVLLIDSTKLSFARMPKVFLEVSEDMIAEAFNVLAGYTFFVREDLSESGNLVLEVLVDDLESMMKFVDFDIEHSCILASGVSLNRYESVWIASEDDKNIDKINFKI